MYKKLFTSSALVLGLLLGPVHAATAAEELPAGTVISKANFEQVKDQLFEGKRVGDMIPERMQWMILERGLTMKIRHSEKIEMDEKYMT